MVRAWSIHLATAIGFTLLCLQRQKEFLGSATKIQSGLGFHRHNDQQTTSIAAKALVSQIWSGLMAMHNVNLVSTWSSALASRSKQYLEGLRSSIKCIICLYQFERSPSFCVQETPSLSSTFRMSGKKERKVGKVPQRQSCDSMFHIQDSLIHVQSYVEMGWDTILCFCCDWGRCNCHGMEERAGSTLSLDKDLNLGPHAPAEYPMQADKKPPNKTDHRHEHLEKIGTATTTILRHHPSMSHRSRLQNWKL